MAVTASLNDVLRWVHCWHGTEALSEDVSPEHLRYELNADFEAATLGAKEVSALVAAWLQGAISRVTPLHIWRAGKVLPSVRSNEQELELIAAGPASGQSTINSQPSLSEELLPPARTNEQEIDLLTAEALPGLSSINCD